MDCIFCKIVKGEISSYKVYEDDKVLAFLDVNPLVNGHTLIVPKTHFKDIREIDDETMNHIRKIGNELADKLMSSFDKKGCTFNINYGANQEIKHLHMHILPGGHMQPNDLSLEDAYKKISN